MPSRQNYLRTYAFIEELELRAFDEDGLGREIHSFYQRSPSEAREWRQAEKWCFEVLERLEAEEQGYYLADPHAAGAVLDRIGSPDGIDMKKVIRALRSIARELSEKIFADEESTVRT